MAPPTWPPVRRQTHRKSNDDTNYDGGTTKDKNKSLKTWRKKSEVSNKHATKKKKSKEENNIPVPSKVPLHIYTFAQC